MRTPVFTALVALSFISPAASSEVVETSTERTCAQVAREAREAMVARQGGLSWQATYRHLVTDDLSQAIHSAAHSRPHITDATEAWPEVDRFSGEWLDRCERRQLD